MTRNTPKDNPTGIHQQLSNHQALLASPPDQLSSLFLRDPERTSKLTFACGPLRVDLSKNLLDERALQLLISLAEEQELPARRQALLDGETVNTTERRAALHTALRGYRAANQPETGREVEQVLDQMQAFVEQIHAGQRRGSSGEKIRDVVNIGIGGSDLGPAMVTAALRRQHNTSLRCHFVSNIDPAHLQACLATLDPASTLFIVASKSFSTLETLNNALLARQWLLTADADADVSRHFVAVSSNIKAATEFGIAASNIFPMWDWVGGRFSLWSAIGLPIALATSMATFRQLLSGAALMDQHFAETPLEQNIPVLLGLLTVWYRNYWNAGSHVVLPYAQDLAMLPGYLQQLDMESLGKSVDLAGNALAMQSGPVIWGSAGTNGQHSFHQLLHQGTQMIPADFIAVAQADTQASEQARTQHQYLLANCFSQSRALMCGKPVAQAEQELLDQGLPGAEATRLAPHKRVPGNRPSTTIVLEKLDALSLGCLLATYEHKVFVQSVIWNINAFDQWGVEIGKQLCTPLFEALQSGASSSELDASSAALVAYCRQQTSGGVKD